MATRRPRVPKSSGHALVEAAHRASAATPADRAPAPRTGSTAAPGGTHVGGYSAKVIPLDAAPSRHAAEAPEDRGTPGRHEATGARAAERGAGRTATAVPSAAERRAAARSELLRRARTGGTPRPGQPRPQAAPAAVVEPVPARHFSGHSIALLVVLFLAAVLLAPTLRVFLDQQAELRAVQEDIAAQRQEQQELTDEIARWDDPAYIQQQARDRFNLVMPGEKTYMVIGGDEEAEDPVPAPASPSEVNPDMPWADALWDSVVRAGTD